MRDYNPTRWERIVAFVFSILLGVVIFSTLVLGTAWLKGDLHGGAAQSGSSYNSIAGDVAMTQPDISVVGLLLALLGVVAVFLYRRLRRQIEDELQ